MTARRWTVAALVVVAYVVPTWIQVAPPPDRFDAQFATNPGDPVLLMWTMRHGAEALVSSPASVFDANIFHPLDGTLAYSDNLLAFAPVFGLASAGAGGDPVAAYNVTAIVVYLAGALAVFALARWLFGSDAVAFVAGLVFTLAPYRSVMVAHIQLAGVAFVVLALLFVMRFLRDRRLSDAALAGLAVGGTWYSAQYYALAAAIAVPLFVAIWLVQRWRRPGWVSRPELGRRFAAGGAMFAAVVAAVVGPTLGLYTRIQGTGLFERGDAEILRAQWYFWRQLPPSWLWGHLANRECCQGDRGGYYPGALVLVLVAIVIGGAALALFTRRSAGDRPPDPTPDRWQEFRVPLLVAMGVFIPLLFGPALEPQLAWEAATEVVPGLSSVRDTGRFWMFPLLGLVVLAARGLHLVIRNRRPATVVVTCALVYAVAWAELVYAPHMASIDEAPAATAAYEMLAALEPGVVTELPVPYPDPSWPLVVAPRQLRSLRDGNPRLEGYSGAVPPSVLPSLEAGRGVPDPAAVEFLRQRGTRYLLLHGGSEPCLGGFGPRELGSLVEELAGSPQISRIVSVPASADVIVELEPHTDPARLPRPPAGPPRRAPYCAPP